MSNPLPQNKLMAHMIPWYPNRSGSFAAACAILSGGAAYIEIQFPFSDPSADGPVIEQACQKAIAQGFKVEGGFAFVREVADWIGNNFAGNYPPTIFIMSYASLVVARGVERFVAAAKAAGASGIIVPDLPPDSDEGLYASGRKQGIAIVPVVVPFISSERLDLVLATKPDYVYCALRAGITGVKTDLGPELRAFLKTLASRGSQIFGGFGITEPAQVASLAGSVHAVVVGSQLVRTIDQVLAEGGDDRLIFERMQEFVGQLVSAK